MLVTKACHGNLGLVVVVVSRGACLGPPTASLRRGTGVPWVSLPGPTSVPSDAQAGGHREQSANPVPAVSASPVVSPALANVFVRLSKQIVMLEFCDMQEYLHACSTIALPCELIVVFDCPTPLFNVTPDVTRQISSSPVVCSETFQFSLDHKLFIRHAVCSRSFRKLAVRLCSRSLPLRWSWLERSALFVVELWPCFQQPPSRFVSTAASLLLDSTASFAAVVLASSPAWNC